MDTTAFVNRVKAHDATITIEDMSKMKFDMQNAELSCDAGVFSERAIGNLCSCLSISRGMIKDLSLPLLNSLVKEQMVIKEAKLYRMGRDPDDPKKISFIAPKDLPYINAAEVVNMAGNDLWKIWGDPVASDGLRILTRNRDITGIGEDLFSGLDIKFSPNGRGATVIDEALHRVICENGLIARELGHRAQIAPMKVEGKVIQAIIKEYAAGIDQFTQRIDQFTVNAQQRPVDDSVENVFDSVDATKYVPRTVTKFCRNDGEAIKTGSTEFQSAGLTALNNLWDYTNLITMNAQRLTSLNARLSTEMGAFKWAHQVLNPLLN